MRNDEYENGIFPLRNGQRQSVWWLCQSDFHKPGMDGIIVYLSGNPD
jgi:hypothetical protein